MKVIFLGSGMAHLISYLVKTQYAEGFMWRHAKQAMVMLGACSDCEGVNTHESYCRVNRPKCPSCGIAEDQLFGINAHAFDCTNSGQSK